MKKIILCFMIFAFAISGILVIPDGGVIPILDVTLLGLKADFDNFNIFLEACMPATALIKVGASYKF